MEYYRLEKKRGFIQAIWERSFAGDALLWSDNEEEDFSTDSRGAPGCSFELHLRVNLRTDDYV